MARAPQGHRTLPHTADVILEAWGPDLATCCEEAVAALVETYADSRSVTIVGERAVHVATAPAHDTNLQQPAPKARMSCPRRVLQCADLRLLGSTFHRVRSGSSIQSEIDSCVSTCRRPDQTSSSP
jgi:hypothetical protein